MQLGRPGETRDGGLRLPAIARFIEPVADFIPAKVEQEVEKLKQEVSDAAAQKADQIEGDDPITQ